MKKKTKTGYQSGGPIKPNIQTLGNIKFDSNKARKGKFGNLIVQDINSGKEFGVYRKPNGSYEFLNTKDTVKPWENWNPKNWNVPEYTQQSEFTDAFNLAKSQGNKEFVWHGNRYAVKDVDPSIRNAVEVSRQQVIDELKSMGNTKYVTNPKDTSDALLEAALDKRMSMDQRFEIYDYNNNPGKYPFPETAAAKLDSLRDVKQEKIRKRYADKIEKVKAINPIVTSEKGLEASEGYVEGKKKMFVYGKDSLHAVNTARHEFRHVAQD